jgi:hypothetical protein
MGRQDRLVVGAGAWSAAAAAAAADTSRTVDATVPVGRLGGLVSRLGGSGPGHCRPRVRTPLLDLPRRLAGRLTCRRFRTISRSPTGRALCDHHIRKYCVWAAYGPPMGYLSAGPCPSRCVLARLAWTNPVFPETGPKGGTNHRQQWPAVAWHTWSPTLCENAVGCCSADATT